MTTDIQQGIDQPADQSVDRRRALRTTGTALVAGAAAVLLTPITVFLVPWTAIDPGYADPTSWRDPLMTAAVGWIGPIYGVQYLVLAAVLVIAALAVRPLLAASKLATAGTAAAVSAAAMLLVFGGSTASWYSEMVAPALAEVQPDPAVRKIAGFADMLNTQGLMGAAGVCVMVWLVTVASGARRAELFGRAPAIIAIVFLALGVTLYVSGRGAGAGLIMVVPMAAVGLRMLLSARR